MATVVPNLKNLVSETNMWAQTYIDDSNDPITLVEDALALSCCAYRTSKDRGYTNIHSPQLVKLLTDEDRQQAELIRKYYGQKIMWSRLQGKHVSQFREDLFSYIHSDPKIVTEKLSGLICKMPEFYKEDMTLERIKKLADTDFSEINPPSILRKTVVKSLKPLEIIERRSKRIKNNVYWLLDGDNRLCELVIPQPNPLEPIWLDIFNNRSTININAYYFHKRREDFNYYTISKWTLEK